MCKEMREQINRVKNWKQFLNENKKLSLRDNVVSIIRNFCNEYGNPLAAHPHIKRIEKDVLYILAERIDKFLNYGDYRKIWSIINKFNNNDAMFDDNNVILTEIILDELNLF